MKFDDIVVGKIYSTPGGAFSRKVIFKDNKVFLTEHEDGGYLTWKRHHGGDQDNISRWVEVKPKLKMYVSVWKTSSRANPWCVAHLDETIYKRTVDDYTTYGFTKLHESVIDIRSITAQAKDD